MALSMTPLLIHSEAISADVRAALKAAQVSPPESRDSALESAARLLYRQTASLDCRDVRELVGLPTAQPC